MPAPRPKTLRTATKLAGLAKLGALAGKCFACNGTGQICDGCGEAENACGCAEDGDESPGMSKCETCGGDE